MGFFNDVSNLGNETAFSLNGIARTVETLFAPDKVLVGPSGVGSGPTGNTTTASNKPAVKTGEVSGTSHEAAKLDQAGASGLRTALIVAAIGAAIYFLVLRK